jgi:hypothetical protein
MIFHQNKIIQFVIRTKNAIFNQNNTIFNQQSFIYLFMYSTSQYREMLPIYHFCMLSTVSNCNGDVVKCIVLGKCH